MIDKISNEMFIKEKADFIYLNSGLIASKLDNDFTKFDTENNLQILLFYDTKIDDLPEIKFELLIKNTPVIYESNYESSMKIIFHIAELIDESNYTADGKERLRDKLRLYNKYFNYDNKDLVKNKQFVRLIEKS